MADLRNISHFPSPSLRLRIRSTVLWVFSQELQFKLQCKTQIVSAGRQAIDNCHLVSAASQYGLIFIGAGHELKGKEVI